MSAQIFELCSTDGDFELDSNFQPIPGSFLRISLEKSGVVVVSCKIMVQGEVHGRLLLDGSVMAQWNAERNFSDPFSVALSTVFLMDAGAHEIGISAKSTGAAGPRDWSPRWDKEGKPFGKILRSPECPLNIVAIAQKV